MSFSRPSARTATACSTASSSFPAWPRRAAPVDRPAGVIVDAGLDAGLVCLNAGPNVLRLAPPLVVGADEIDHALSILTEVLA